jgi:hypothetical protein
LRTGIAKERSCASVLVIPQRKISLCEALDGRAAMTGVGASMEPMGSSLERGKRGNEEGEGRGVAGLLLGGP